MSNSPSRLSQWVAFAHPYFARRYLKRWLALFVVVVALWLVWPFAALIGRLPEVAALIRLAPGLAGMDRPKTYMILVENEDELRATGGYITAAGTVTVHYGRVTNLAIEDVFAIDNL